MSSRLVIIGNGVSGVTAARLIRKRSDRPITVISGESAHFYSRPALMYVYMGHLRYADTKPYEDWFWKKNNIDLVFDFVTSVDTESKCLALASGSRLCYDELVIATGSRSNRFGWPGQDLHGVQGLYGLGDLRQMEQSTAGIDRAVVVGGGLIGVEMAEMLHSRHIPVTFLVREAGYMDYLLPSEECEVIRRAIERHRIDLRLNTELKEIVGDSAGRASAVVTSDGESIPAQFVGLATGVSPNVDFLRNGPIEVDRGILVNDRFETSVEGVYAVGDCAQFRNPPDGKRPIEQLWYSGRRQAKFLAGIICGGRRDYDRGVFFNSAKFFNVEYQTYGDVPASELAGESSILWVSDDGTRLVRVQYRLDTGVVRGFNLFGVRFRHEVCERWILEGTKIDGVLATIRTANFDPEFFGTSGPYVRPGIS